MTERSDAERQLIRFAREEFGEPLSALLLAGYGEDKRVRSRRFVIDLEDESGGRQQRYLKIVADRLLNARAQLPSGREPLVLLAVIRLLLNEGAEIPRRLAYPRNAMLRLLGCRCSSVSWEFVNGAVTKYFNLSYQPVDSLNELTGRSAIEYTCMHRIITGHGTLGGLKVRGQPEQRIYGEVTFNLHFIERLRRRSLFDMDWGRVHSISQLPSAGNGRRN
jgi:hypothetical protein